MYFEHARSVRVQDAPLIVIDDLSRREQRAIMLLLFVLDRQENNFYVQKRTCGHRVVPSNGLCVVLHTFSCGGVNRYIEAAAVPYLTCPKI